MLVLIGIISYLIGCFSSAYIIGMRVRKMDLRSYGSGNLGATNAFRILGKKLGLITFILDFLKGGLASYIAYRLMGDTGRFVGGLFVVLGHNYPVFLKFKGGKGVATSLGVLMALSPLMFFICLGVGLLIVLLTSYVSLASITLSLLAPIIYLLVGNSIEGYGFKLVLILGILSLYRHKDNIKRLIRGEENKLKL